MKQIEILAPAGSFEGMAAAINASCDAIYIGGSKFGARAYANNLEQENMLKAIDYAHIHNKKIYITVNTLLKNSELENELYNYIYQYYKQGVDAVIVQDLGVLHFIHEHFPDLDIHASTQMSLTMSEGANTLKKFGVTRLVNARELGLDEISAIRRNTDLEIESFVHGALCFCYSGQCLMSSMFGGRSGNRGRCAQPCRMQYQLSLDDKIINNTHEKYILSPKDICTLDMIPELIEAGIDSFKIEGRMKRPEYTAGVTYAYKKYVDLYLELGKEKYEAYIKDHEKEFREELLNLHDLYNRGGFSQGYYASRNGRIMMSLSRPNHSGLKVGTVTAVKGNQGVMKLIEDIHGQDILEVRDGSEGVYEFTVKNDEKKGNSIHFNFKKDSKVKPGAFIFRTKNNQLLDEINRQFMIEEKKEAIKGHLIVKVGEPLKIELRLREHFVCVEGNIVDAAKNQPMTEEKLRKQIMKTNDSSYIFNELKITLIGDAFIPVQKLNELRRSGLEKLTSFIVSKYRRMNELKTNELKTTEFRTTELKTNEFRTTELKTTELKTKELKTEERNHILKADINSIPSNEEAPLNISIAVSNKEQLITALKIPEVSKIYLDSDITPLSRLPELTRMIRENKKECYLILPHIFRKATYEFFLKNKTYLDDNTINGYIIRNLEEYVFLTEELNILEAKKEIITDYNLYVMNRRAAAFWSELGIQKTTAPVELNYSELKELSGLFEDIIVYGKIPLMVTAQCLVKTVSGESNKNYNKTNEVPCCKGDVQKVELIDRMQKKFQVKRHCRDCYNTIYNSQSLSLLQNSYEVKQLKTRNLRLNFTFESSEETKNIIEAFVKTYIYNDTTEEVTEDFTRGHFKRGIE